MPFMPRTFAAVALLLTVAAAYPQATPQRGNRNSSAWERFTSEEGRFSVLMPGRPEHERKNIRSKTGSPVVINSDMVDLKSRAYMVMISDYVDTNITLEGAIDGILSASPGYTILERRHDPFAGYPGRYLEIKTSGFHAIYRLFVVGNRLYQIGYIAELDEFSRERYDYFVNSFRLFR